MKKTYWIVSVLLIGVIGLVGYIATFSHNFKASFSLPTYVGIGLTANDIASFLAKRDIIKFKINDDEISKFIKEKEGDTYAGLLLASPEAVDQVIISGKPENPSEILVISGIDIVGQTNDKRIDEFAELLLFVSQDKTNWNEWLQECIEKTKISPENSTKINKYTNKIAVEYSYSKIPKELRVKVSVKRK